MHWHLPLTQAELLPQSALTVQVLPVHAPGVAPVQLSVLPHWVDDVHVGCAEHVPGVIVQVPEPQSALTAQVHLPATQRSPWLPQFASTVQVLALQLPETEPLQLWVVPHPLLTQACAVQSPTCLQVPDAQLPPPPHTQKPPEHFAPPPPHWLLAVQGFGLQ